MLIASNQFIFYSETMHAAAIYVIKEVNLSSAKPPLNKWRSTKFGMIFFIKYTRYRQAGIILCMRSAN